MSYVTLAYALARAGHTGYVSAVLYVVPPVSILFGWVFLRESPTMLAIVGGAIALVGVGIATRPRPPTGEPSSPESGYPERASPAMDDPVS